MNRRTILLALLVAASVSATDLYARPGATPPAPAKKRVVTLSGDVASSRPLSGDNSFTTLDGDAVIASDDATLTTQKATYNGETQIATAPTRLKLEDKQNTLTADKGVAYYSTRDADFTGNVVIVARPKQGTDGAGAAKGSLRRNFKDPVTITCGNVKYNWRTKKAVLTGNLTIKQKDRTITGDRGLYDGVAETVTLVGNVKSRRPTGEAFDAPGAGARVVACFTEGKEQVTTFKDPAIKAKLRGQIPLRETANGDFEVVDTVPGAPSAAPAPQESPAAVPEPSPTPEVPDVPAPDAVP